MPSENGCVMEVDAEVIQAQVGAVLILAGMPGGESPVPFFGSSWTAKSRT